MPRATFTCEHCGKVTEGFASVVKLRRFCSLSCRSRVLSRRTYAYRPRELSPERREQLVEQGKRIGAAAKGRTYALSDEERKRRSDRLIQYHSGRTNAGPESPTWQGGRYLSRAGYVKIYMPSHPFAVKNYVWEHRIVMERLHGRYLGAGEVVHHLNGIRDDNRQENLVVLTPSEHMAIHRALDGNIPQHAGRVAHSHAP